jgi:pyruvate, orthophosphate dikinase
MFGAVVLGVPDEVFEAVITPGAAWRGGRTPSSRPTTGRRSRAFKEIVRTYTRQDFPEEPLEQLRLATEAVFRSWNGKRAVDYRNAAGIAHDLGTAVNIQAMVFGNMGDDCATGVVMSRNPTTGEPGWRATTWSMRRARTWWRGSGRRRPWSTWRGDARGVRELEAIARRLEATTATCRTWSSPWSTGSSGSSRPGTASGRRRPRSGSPSDMVDEGLIDRETAVRRVKPAQVDVFLHPQFSRSRSRTRAHRHGPERVAGRGGRRRGLRRRHGGALGREEQRKVIMVRPETKPDDVHGMLAAEGILTRAADAPATRRWSPGSSASRPWWASRRSRSTSRPAP